MAARFSAAVCRWCTRRSSSSRSCAAGGSGGASRGVFVRSLRPHYEDVPPGRACQWLPGSQPLCADGALAAPVPRVLVVAVDEVLDVDEVPLPGSVAEDVRPVSGLIAHAPLLRRCSVGQVA